MRHTAVACLITLFVAAGAQAATRTWQGDVDTNWNTAGNWAENAVPANGDDLVFPDNPTSRDSNNDIAGLSIASVTITTMNSGADYNFSGNGITLTGPMTFANPGAGGLGVPHWNIPLTLGAPFTVTSSGRVAHIDAAIATVANNITVQANGDVWIAGMISGLGSIQKDGASMLTLSGPNTFSGTVLVNAGSVRTGSATALGGNAASAIFQNATTLVVALGPYTLSKPLIFNGPTATVVMGSGNNQLSGTLSFFGTLTFQMDESGSISGSIGSNGTIVVLGPNGLSTIGDSPAFAGFVDIQGGQFIPQGTFPAAITLQSGGLFGTATSGPLTITGGVFAPGLVTQFFAPFGLASSGGMHNLVMVPGLPVTNYDQIQVTGAVSLGGTTLNSTAAGTLPLGSVFIIILNDGADPVAGTYVGKPEGAIYFQAGNWWQITYVGNDGNDVVLTTVAAPAQAPSVPVPGPGPLALALLAAGILIVARRRAR